MKVSSQDGSRSNQAWRTRRALVEAATALVREGKAPTVAEAAGRALVSRATAYRHFPSQQSLLIEVEADVTQPSPDAVLEGAGPDVEARAVAMIRTLTRMVLADEALFRNQIRSIQELWFARQDGEPVPVREGRRLVWVDKVLEPVADVLPPAVVAQVRQALAVITGVDAVIALRDVCDLDPAPIEATFVWLARAIVREGLSQAESGEGRPADRQVR